MGCICENGVAPFEWGFGRLNVEGRLYLEVPPQVKPIRQSIIDAANEANVLIRDTNGLIYNPAN
jgi:filamentous hemagglutinin